MRIVPAVVFVGMVLVLACTTSPSPTSRPTTTGGEEATITSATQYLPSQTMPTITPSDDDGTLIAYVTRVIDGDTINVEFIEGSVENARQMGLEATETVRLLGVDTPETYSSNNPGEYGDITDIGCLGRWGDLATDFAVETLGQQTVELVLDSDAGLRGFYGRLLAYVLVKDVDFNAQLVELGYARVYEEGSSRREAVYLSLQRGARAQSIGLWECEGSSMPTSPSTTGVAPTIDDGTETPGGNCDAAYPTVCVPPPPPDLDCGEILFTNFTVLVPDPHRFDGDKDGVGCER